MTLLKVDIANSPLGLSLRFSGFSLKRFAVRAAPRTGVNFVAACAAGVHSDRGEIACRNNLKPLAPISFHVSVRRLSFEF